MKKVKLIVSDFHMGNGKYREDGTVNSLEDFQYDDEFIEFLEYHDDSGEEQELELILNGDIFNMIQLLPEEQDQGILTERAAVAKAETIISGHRSLFNALKKFNSKPHRRLVFILGNHDPQLLWKGVRDIIKRTVQGEVVFIESAYKFDGVHIEHGHELEPIFKMKKDRYFLTKGYPEPILNLPWGVFFVKDYLYNIKKRRPFVDKVSPYRLFLRWCFLNDFWFGFLSIFSYMWFILKTRFSPLPLKREGALKGFGAIFFLERSPTLSKEVAQIIEREKCRTVILGHTHIPLHVNLGQGEYLNTGSWNDITHLDVANLGQGKQLIYARIDYIQGKPQARLQEWFGLHHPFRSIRG